MINHFFQIVHSFLKGEHFLLMTVYSMITFIELNANDIITDIHNFNNKQIKINKVYIFVRRCNEMAMNTYHKSSRHIFTVSNEKASLTFIFVFEI